MTTPCRLERLYRRAQALAAELLAQELRGNDAVEAILEAFVEVRHEAQDETLDIVEQRLIAISNNGWKS